MRRVAALAAVAIVGGAASSFGGETVSLGPQDLERVAAGRWQGYAVSLMEAQATGNAVATTRTRNEAAFTATYQWRDGTATSTVEVQARASGSGLGSGPGASNARASGRLIVSASRAR